MSLTIMTREEVINEVCEIVALVYRSTGDYTYACDGFCSACEKKQGPLWSYRNDSSALTFIRQAVLEKLQQNGIKVHPDFDPRTGRLQ